MKKRAAFTLIELLVVIAIVSLLVSIVIPALKGARIQAHMAVCLANLNGLSKAYHSYADNHDSRLVNGDVPRYPEQSGVNLLSLGRRPPYWVDCPQDENYRYTGEPSQAPGPPTLEHKKLGIMRGALFDYVGDPAAYHCPGDLSRILVPNGLTGRDANPHPDNYSYCSYSVSDMLNAWNPTNDRRAVKKMTEILNPGIKFVFIESTDNRGWLMGSWNFLLERTPPQSDTLAIWHRKRSGFGYADGHGEIHTWTDPDIIAAAADPKRTWFSYTNTSSDDFRFLVRGYIPGRNTK
ncbi:MAG: prepilin-type N-terminal cleavage/methylation domain-containing protein [Anaerohalosphaeraceae bacterium]